MNNHLTFQEWKLFEELNIEKINFIRIGSSAKGLSRMEDPFIKQLNKKAINTLFNFYFIKDSYSKIEITKPFIYYGGFNDIGKQFIKDYKIPIKNLYNLPDNMKKSGDKILFHKLFKNKKYVPKTVFSKKDISDLTFPIIGKIKNGHSGIGIQKLDSFKDIKDDFDLYSEFVDFDSEYRASCLKDKVLLIEEKINNIEKNKHIKNKSKDDAVSFVYVVQDVTKLSFMNKLNEILNDVRKILKLDVFSLDFFIKGNDIFLIEVNSASGLSSRKLALYYKKIYEDFYNLKLSKNIESFIDNTFIYSQLKREFEIFEKEIKKSKNSIDYKKIK